VVAGCQQQERYGSISDMSFGWQEQTAYIWTKVDTPSLNFLQIGVDQGSAC
jgi:hypothetical protein